MYSQDMGENKKVNGSIDNVRVKHYVLFQFKPDAPLEEISKRAHEELVQIPGVSNLSFGKTLTDRGKGYTHILALDLPDVSGLTHRFPPSILFGIS
jgi:hypothetical protein